MVRSGAPFSRTLSMAATGSRSAPLPSKLKAPSSARISLVRKRASPRLSPGKRDDAPVARARLDARMIFRDLRNRSTLLSGDAARVSEGEEYRARKRRGAPRKCGQMRARDAGEEFSQGETRRVAAIPRRHGVNGVGADIPPAGAASMRPAPVC